MRPRCESLRRERSRGRSCPWAAPTVRLRLATLACLGLVLSSAAQAQTASSEPEDSTLSIVLYGFLFGQLAVDANQTGRDPFLNIQPLPGSPGVPNTDPDAFFDVSATRVGLDVELNANERMGVFGNLEIDFDTPTGAPRIRHAYGELTIGAWRVLAGQTWSIVSQLDPTTIDSDNLFNIGNTYERVPQFRFSYGHATERGTLELQVGAATFFGEFDQIGLAVQVDPAAPETLRIAPNTPPVLQSRLSYGWERSGRPGHVAVGGSIGRVDLRGESGAEGDATHVLVVGEVLVPLSTTVELMLEAFYGEAPGFNGGIGQTAVVTANGSVVPVESWGGFGQAALNPGAGVNINLVGGLDNPKKSPGGTALILSRNVTLLGNVFWEVIEHFTAAFELQYIQSDYEKAAAAADNVRSTFAVYVNF